MFVSLMEVIVAVAMSTRVAATGYRQENGEFLVIITIIITISTAISTVISTAISTVITTTTISITATVITTTTSIYYRHGNTILFHSLTSFHL